MEKIIISILAFMILSLTFFSGCLNDNNTNEQLDEIYVDINGGADFDNILDAINNIASGGTIYVNEGIYYELLTINKPINLIGDGSGRAIIIQSIENNSIDSIIHIFAENCTISGFNISCDRNSLSNEVIGINISSSNNIISNNIINGASKGIYLVKNSNNNIFDNIISNCSSGIYTLSAENNNISKNDVSICDVYGIYIFSSDNNIIFNNILSDNNYGIRIKGSAFNRVFNNTVSKNKQGALCCCGAENNVIYNNIFKQNQFYNGADEIDNQWDNGFIGNYWDDYTIKNPNAIQLNGIWDTPYNVSDCENCNNLDRYPLVNPPEL